MRKNKKLKVIYEYIGDRSPEDKKRAEKNLNEVYNMLFEEIREIILKENKQNSINNINKK